MFRKTNLLLSLCALTALTACANAPVPMASTFPVSTQMTVRAAGHWQALSKDIATKTLESLRKAGSDKPIFVVTSKNESTFDTAFKALLTTELVNAGVKVKTHEAGALKLGYSAQIVNHKSVKEDFRSGKYTRLVSGLWVLGAVAAESTTGFALTTLALAGMKDYVVSEEGAGKGFELILTTTIDNEDQFVARKTDVYYVESADSELYIKSSQVKSNQKEMKVVQ